MKQIATVDDALLVQLTRTKYVPCSTVQEASRIVRAYIEKANIGASTFAGGSIFDVKGARVALVSYNGRIWKRGENPKGSHLTSYVNGEPYGILVNA